MSDKANISSYLEQDNLPSTPVALTTSISRWFGRKRCLEVRHEQLEIGEIRTTSSPTKQTYAATD